MEQINHAGLACCRPEVKNIRFWLERDMPGLVVRHYLEHPKPVILRPGQPLDLEMPPQLFKHFVSEYFGLSQSVDRDIRHYLDDLARCRDCRPVNAISTS